MHKNIIKNKAVYLTVLLVVFASGIVHGTSTETITSSTTDLTIDFGENWVNASNATFGKVDVTGDISANAYIGDGGHLSIAWLNNTFLDSIAWCNNTFLDSVEWMNNTKIQNSNGKSWSATGANIQLAIDDLGDVGGTVWLPTGTITVSAVINVDSNITITGTGVGTVLFLADGSDCDVFDITTESNITIENFLIDGNNASNTDNPLIDIQSAGAGNAATRYITVRDMVLLNCGTSMVDVHYDDNSWYLLVENCRFDGIERDQGQYPAGIWFSGFNAILKNNWIENTYGSGIVIEAASAEAMAQNIVIDGNFVTGYTGYGILAEGGGDTANMTVVNNHIWDLSSDSYHVAEGGALSTGIRVTGNSTIANNYIFNVHRYGIYSEGDYNKVIGNTVELVTWKQGIQLRGNSICTGNTVKRVTGATKDGILATNEGFTEGSFVITSNYIYDVTGNGIEIGFSGDLNHSVVSNNHIGKCDEDAINIIDVHNSSFMGNVMWDYGTLAIDEDAASDANVFIGNVGSDAGNDFDFGGMRNNHTCNMGQIV